MQTNINKQVCQYIDAHIHLRPKHLHLVALSGGADSTALLLIMKELGYQVEAIHCNFSLRGNESDRDEKFCIHLCEQQHIPLHLTHFDTRTYAHLHHISIEMAARQLRYDYFEHLRVDLGADTILLAHHKEDQVETLLLNLARGTGLSGLKGMLPLNGHLARPLLPLTKKDLTNYLDNRQQPYVTDSSNLHDDVLRNKVRLHLLPLLQEINSAAINNIYQTACHLQEADKIVRHYVDHWLAQDTNSVCYLPYPHNLVGDIAALDTGVDISISSLQKSIGTEHILYAILTPFGFHEDQILQIYRQLSHCAGQLWQSASHEATLDRGHLIVQNRQKPFTLSINIPEAGCYNYNSYMKLKVEIINIDEQFRIPHHTNITCLDARHVQFPLQLRPYREGERFQPLGMDGTKLISDYLTDKKKNIFQKRQQLVVADATDNIIWLVNERPSQKCRINNDTQQVVRIEII